MNSIPPVVIVVFNRPQATARLIAALARVRPPHLLVVGDGPRPDRIGESEQVQQVRRLFAKLRWDCEVETNWSDENLGCRRRVSSGITWAFTRVSEAIILEDDCLPDASFFGFCGELLERYRHDTRIGSISGTNYMPEPCAQDSSSYYFSRYNLFWGWATWRRAWELYDDSMEFCRAPEFMQVMRRYLGSWRAAAYWAYILRATEKGQRDSWGYRWLLSGWRENMLSIVPRQSMVTNVGMQADSTHTSDVAYRLQRAAPMNYPLVHPSGMYPHASYDALVEDTFFSRCLSERLAGLR